MLDVAAFLGGFLLHPYDSDWQAPGSDEVAAPMAIDMK